MRAGFSRKFINWTELTADVPGVSSDSFYVSRVSENIPGETKKHKFKIRISKVGNDNDDCYDDELNNK